MPDQFSSKITTAEQIDNLLNTGHVHEAHQLIRNWLMQWIRSMPSHPNLSQLRKKELWRCLYSVIEHTHDDSLNEAFWQMLDGISPPSCIEQKLPLLGVPILNRFDLLENMLDSLDYPVQTLAIVDNSVSLSSYDLPEISHKLNELKSNGHPLIDEIHIARGFGNMGVAASWNLILTSFPQSSLTLLINNDVCLAPGVLAEACTRVNTDRPQFLSLFPGPQTFSAFLITAKAWDRVGLFDINFYPAYCEDLDYGERLRSDSSVEWLDGKDFHESMKNLNPESSQTINSDSNLARQNELSYALNRLWFLSHRRVRGDKRGSWVRHWLNQWET